MGGGFEKSKWLGPRVGRDGCRGWPLKARKGLTQLRRYSVFRRERTSDFSDKIKKVPMLPDIGLAKSFDTA